MSGSPPTRAKLIKTIAGLHTTKFKQCIRYKKKSNGVKLVTFNANLDAAGCAALADGSERVETYFCEEGGGPPKGESCTPKKTYSYNFETMQPTNSPTPQG